MTHDHALSPATLKDLAARRHDACVSIFMPIDTAEPRHVGRTRLDNLVAEAEHVLRHERDEPPSRPIIEQFGSLRRDGPNLSEGQGLAVFLDSDGHLETHHLPWPVPMRFSVGHRFAITPLLPAARPATFYVIALSRDRVRSFGGDRGGLVELDLPLLPTEGTDEVPGADSATNRLQAHSNGKDVVFHGHRDDTKGEDERLARLCRQTGEALRRHMSRRDLPVVVMAVTRLAALFKKEVDWMNVVAVVGGNPDSVGPEAIHARAWPSVAEHLEREVRAQEEELGDAVHHGRGSRDVADIVLSAHDGRIEKLFVAPDEPRRWGTFDGSKRRVEVHDLRRPGDEDLVNLAVSETLCHGGEVITPLPGGGGTTLAAVYRH
ncbi:MAG: hypothetical protein KC731_04055 [Myxococcales bacterium]|nr:hypothetical protein [Myxococcales bacterium]